MSDMPERFFMNGRQARAASKRFDSGQAEYIRADLAAERIAELEKALCLMIVHGKADLLDETDFEFAEGILTGIDAQQQENNNAPP